jgi:hypothetical protein
MKTIIMTIALMVITSLQSQNLLVKHQDKVLHFTVGSTLSTFSYCGFYKLTKSKKEDFWLSFGISTLMGVGKELYDRKKYNSPIKESAKDLGATMLGGFLAAFTLKITL